MKAPILQHLKAHGEQLDAEIAKALRMTMKQVHDEIVALAAAGEVICCQVTRFNGDKKIEGTSCRLAAYVPPKATGPKPGSKRGANNNANHNTNSESHIS